MPSAFESVIGLGLVVWLVYRTRLALVAKTDWLGHARTVLFLGGLWVLAVGFWSARWQ